MTIRASTLHDGGIYIDDSPEIITDDGNFQVRIKLLREMLHLSQERFAQWLLDTHLIEISRETIIQWESGRLPSKSYKRVLYSIIDYHLNEMIGEHEYR